jgi:3-oxoacyl-[acyl-carrier protein] reductase
MRSARARRLDEDARARGRPKGITGEHDLPGPDRHERLRSLGGDLTDVSQIPLARLGEPAEIAPSSAFLASDRAGYVTGAVVPVDGGVTRNLL